jgi:hypothetical protein
MILYQLCAGHLGYEGARSPARTSPPNQLPAANLKKWFKIEYSLSEASLTAHARESDGVYDLRRPRGLVVACCNPIGVRAPSKHYI